MASAVPSPVGLSSPADMVAYPPADSLISVRALPAVLSAAALLCWGVVWTGMLMLPPGYTDQRCVIRMNMAHGIVAAILSSATIVNGWESKIATSASVSFFAVDAVVMFLEGRRTGARGQKGEAPGRWMDYVHHVIGAIYGSYILYNQLSYCSASCPAPNLYTYAQTNEFSTPFYGMYRLNKTKLNGGLFALTFFLSRIVFNFMYLVPYGLKYCSLFGFTIFILPYQVLQVMWMVFIVRKVIRSVRGQASKSKVTAAEKPKTT